MANGEYTPEQLNSSEISSNQLTPGMSWGGEWNETGPGSAREALLRGIRRQFPLGETATGARGTWRENNNPGQDYLYIMTNIMGGGRLIIPPAAHGASSQRFYNPRYANPYHGASGPVGRALGAEPPIFPGTSLIPNQPTPRVQPIRNEWTYNSPEWLRAGVAEHVGLSNVPGAGEGLTTTTVTSPGPTSGELPTLRVTGRTSIPGGAPEQPAPQRPPEPPQPPAPGDEGNYYPSAQEQDQGNHHTFGSDMQRPPGGGMQEIDQNPGK